MKKKLLFLVLGSVLLMSGCSAKDTTQVVMESTTEEVSQTVIVESMLEEEVQTATKEYQALSDLESMMQMVE